MASIRRWHIALQPQEWTPEWNQEGNPKKELNPEWNKELATPDAERNIAYVTDAGNESDDGIRRAEGWCTVSLGIVQGRYRLGIQASEMLCVGFKRFCAMLLGKGCCAVACFRGSAPWYAHLLQRGGAIPGMDYGHGFRTQYEPQFGNLLRLWTCRRADCSQLWRRLSCVSSKV